MTEFIDKLSDEEQENLLEKIGFDTYLEGWLTGSGFAGVSWTHENGYLFVEVWDHYTIHPEEYQDKAIRLNDYDLECNVDNGGMLNKYLQIMFDKFGNNWYNKAIEYWANKDLEVAKYLENLKSEKSVRRVVWCFEKKYRALTNEQRRELLIKLGLIDNNEAESNL